MPRLRPRIEPARAGLARARKQPEHLGQRQRLECSLEHAAPPRHTDCRQQGPEQLSGSTLIERSVSAHRAPASTATGRDLARDQRSTWSAAWCTSIPRPSTAMRADCAGRGEQRRLERVVHEVDDDLTRPQQRRVERRGAVAHADRRRVHDERRRPPPRRRDRPRRRSARVASAAASSAAPARRAVTETATPASAERDDDRPRRHHRHRAPTASRAGGSTPASRSERTKPSPSVESPASDPSACKVTVLTLRSARRVGAERRRTRSPPRSCAAS